MTIRNLAILAAFSSALLGSAVSYAADGSVSGASAGFSAQLSDAKGALSNINSAAVGREERIEAEKYLTMAESLWNNGSAAKAQQFLNFARNELGLSVQPADVTVAEHISEHTTSVH
ncbi:MAG TPA: hypothetical protein VD978_19940 [Azospirillum sp.]|nr:hypothetical protein [Azospirillum sp.]